MKIHYFGIDYGRGQTNIDHETGIRFGVIPVHQLGNSWYEDSEGIYFYSCPICGNEWGENCLDVCPACGNEVDPDEFGDLMEPSFFRFKNKEYNMHQSADDQDIWIEKSPFYTKCQFCSPCAPGAGYIMNPVEDGIKTYCPGPDWFEEDSKIPFPIYRISDDVLLTPDWDKED